MLDDVEIAIPSMGRWKWKDQVTITQFPSSLRFQPNVFIAVPDRELPQYKAGWPKDNIIGIPNNIKGISHTRKWLMERCKLRFLMMLDDDMRFCYRPRMVHPAIKLLRPKHIEILKMLAYWRALGEDYIHVGLSPRNGNNLVTEEVLECKRMYNAYMYDMDAIRALGNKLHIGRLPVMEDFDLTLQLLKLGYPNAMIYKWCWNQYGGSNAPGGCSSYRTAKLQEETAKKLLALHPEVVRLSVKQQDAWLDMPVRTDVIVSWQKAYDMSKENK